MINIPPRIFGIKARRAPLIVLIRRGPSRWAQLIRWQTDDDKFEPGQWVNARVFERRADLSPRGEFLIYFASNYANKETPTWTAISRPPYWSAIHFVRHGDSWGGGGLMPTDNRFRLNGRRGEDYPIFAERLDRDGWQLEQEFSNAKGQKTHTRRLSLPAPDRQTLLVMNAHRNLRRRPGRGCYFETYQLRYADGKTLDLPDVEWADWDAKGRLVYAKNGKIFTAGGHEFNDEQLLFTATTDAPTTLAPPAWAIAAAELEQVV